jgi:cellulose synthase/poly-beta-1,6-N-acetylglucosamine synthase-like glycosyltransferase
MTTWFILCLVGSGYAYLGYPLLLGIAASVVGFFRDKAKLHAAFDLPTVTLLISAFNEESVIAQKIENSLQLKYPREKLEILVASDGSTDATCQIVSRYAMEGVVLKEFFERVGKTECLNRTVPASRGSVVVFSDANSQYDANALMELVRHFGNADVGFVTGHTKYVQSSEHGLVDSVGVYGRLEAFLKAGETRISSCVGADGAIFAVRKGLYRPLHPDDINDFVIPLDVVRRGFRGVFEERAFCTEMPSAKYADEFRRQIRITTRTIRALICNADLMNPARYGLFAMQLISHKMGKLLTPGFLVVLFVLNALLIFEGPAYAAIFLAQIVTYSVAVVPVKSSGFLGRFGGLARTFTLYNLAISVGWWNFLRGNHFRTWGTVRR